MCHQTVSLVQVELERRGIATAALSVMPDITQKVQPPRVVEVDATLGSPLGPPNDVEAHLATLRRMLALAEGPDADLRA